MTDEPTMTMAEYEACVKCVYMMGGGEQCAEPATTTYLDGRPMCSYHAAHQATQDEIRRITTPITTPLDAYRELPLVVAEDEAA